MMPRQTRVITYLVMTLLLLITMAETVLAANGRVAGQVQDSVNNINLMGVLVSADNGQVKTVTDRAGNYSYQPGCRQPYFGLQLPRLQHRQPPGNGGRRQHQHFEYRLRQ